VDWVKPEGQEGLLLQAGSELRVVPVTSHDNVAAGVEGSWDLSEGLLEGREVRWVVGVDVDGHDNNGANAHGE